MLRNYCLSLLSPLPTALAFWSAPLPVLSFGTFLIRWMMSLILFTILCSPFQVLYRLVSYGDCMYSQTRSSSALMSYRSLHAITGDLDLGPNFLMNVVHSSPQLGDLIFSSWICDQVTWRPHFLSKQYSYWCLSRRFINYWSILHQEEGRMLVSIPLVVGHYLGELLSNGPVLSVHHFIRLRMQHCYVVFLTQVELTAFLLLLFISISATVLALDWKCYKLPLKM